MLLTPTGARRDWDRHHVATWTLLGVHALVAWRVHAGGEDAIAWLELALLDPVAFRPHQLLTHTFVDFGLPRIAGNLLCLMVFGRYVEDRVGSLRYLVLYLLLGAISGAIVMLAARTPVLGASGVVAGMMGIVLLAAPGLRIRTLPEMISAWRALHVPASWLIVAWMLLLLTLASHPGAALQLIGIGIGGVVQMVLGRPPLRDTGWGLARDVDGGAPVDPATSRLRGLSAAYEFVDRQGAAEPAGAEDAAPPAYDISPDAPVDEGTSRGG